MLAVFVLETICALAAALSAAVVANKIIKSVSASAPNVIERIFLAAPKNEGNAVVEFALAASNIRSAVLLNVGAVSQLVVTPKFPEVAPVQV